MTEANLIATLALPPEEAVEALKKSSFTLPKWDDLEKEYDPLLHKIQDPNLYPPKLNDNGTDDFERTSFGLQALAVNRISQAMFATPVQRTWVFDTETERTTKAISIIEEIYKIQNNIDAENIERGKKNNASCQVATIWTARQKPDIVKGETTNFKLVHQTYSPMDGYEIYAQKDQYNQIIVISIGYEVDSVEYLDVYANLEKPIYTGYVKGEDGWKLTDSEEGQQNPKELATFPVAYTNLKSPVWGGLAGTNLVEQLEKMESYQGLYIVRNALPTFTLDMGDTSDGTFSETEESSNDSRKVIRLGRGGNMQDKTWQGAENAVSARFTRVRNAFFEQNQFPDNSFANLINSNTSAENKQLLFADVKAKAIDLGGEWAKFFYDEMQIILAFAKIMFPSYATEFDQLSARTALVPYDINSKKDRAEFVNLAGDSMSLETRVRELNAVDNIDNEVNLIEQENSANANQGI